MPHPYRRFRWAALAVSVLLLIVLVCLLQVPKAQLHLAVNGRFGDAPTTGRAVLGFFPLAVVVNAWLCVRPGAKLTRWWTLVAEVCVTVLLLIEQVTLR